MSEVLAEAAPRHDIPAKLMRPRRDPISHDEWLSEIHNDRSDKRNGARL